MTSVHAAMQRAVRRPTTKPSPVPTPSSPCPVVVAATPGQRIVRSPVFVTLVAVVACFLLLLAIRPPFVLKRKDAVSKACIPAFVWSLVAGVLIIGLPTVFCRPTAMVVAQCESLPTPRRSPTPRRPPPPRPTPTARSMRTPY
jgi:hypothetical protein